MPAAAFEATATDGPTFDERVAWLTERGLLSPTKGLSEEQVARQYDALSKCAFGKAVGEESRRNFLRRLLPCEARLAAKQTDIGRVEDPRYHYRLKLRNEVGIKACVDAPSPGRRGMAGRSPRQTGKQGGYRTDSTGRVA